MVKEGHAESWDDVFRLRRSGRPSLFTLIPMAFVMVITLWSLVLQVRTVGAGIAAGGVQLDAALLNGIVSLLLIGLAVVLIVEGLRAAQPSSPARTSAA